jgi:CheY-like chemotaxis protein
MSAVGHVLAVEDNPAFLGVIAWSLRKAGLEVTTAENGLEAWKYLQEHEVDLVVTDFNMPEMTGGDLCAKIGEDPRHRGTPVILMTALAAECEREHCVESLELTEIITKPFSPRRVIDQVMRLLEQSRNSSTTAEEASNDVPLSPTSE